jgi:hypothetical protein
MLDAVFGDNLRYAEAAELQKRALDVGFVGTKLERTGCSTFRVVVTGVPDDPSVKGDFSRETLGVGLPVEFEPAIGTPSSRAMSRRYPPLRVDHCPARSRFRRRLPPGRGRDLLVRHRER